MEKDDLKVTDNTLNNKEESIKKCPINCLALNTEQYLNTYVQILNSAKGREKVSLVLENLL